MKLVHGVGIYDLRDDSSHNVNKKIKGKTVWHCPFYQTWTGMLGRCYSEKWKQKYPTYRGCSVCEEWKTFSNFMAWMKTQSWEGKHLDKDILIPGNKVYSPENCVFVSHSLNNLLCNRNRSRGEFPVGVYLRKDNNRRRKFEVKMTRYGKLSRVGMYLTPEEAHEAYKKERSKYILEVAENLTEDDTADVERTRQGLIRHVKEGLIFK
jgi:hypothetical protein